MKKWTDAVNVVAEMLGEGKIPSTATLAGLLNAIPEGTLMKVLRYTLEQEARNELRRRTLVAEEKSKPTLPSAPPPTLEPLYLGKHLHGWVTSSQGGRKKSAVYFGCECEPCLKAKEVWDQWDADEITGRSALSQKLRGMLNDYVSNLKIEWTTELLHSRFGLRDGTLVTWGQATIGQHQERHKMFSDNAIANIEGAARHQVAIDVLVKANKKCLNDYVQA